MKNLAIFSASLIVLMATVFSCNKDDLKIEVIHGKSGVFTDQRDLATYKYIVINDQVWMAENLAYIPESDESDGSGIQHIYIYGNSDIAKLDKTSTNYKIYGALYNWVAANQLCPDGWHLPSDDEWGNLESFLGMEKSEIDSIGWRETGFGGKKLRTTGNQYWTSLDGFGGLDSYGFSGLPGGFVEPYVFSGINLFAGFWTSTAIEGDSAVLRLLSPYSVGIRRDIGSQDIGFSVRCLKDE